MRCFLVLHSNQLARRHLGLRSEVLLLKLRDWEDAPVREGH